jgi:hypothetical protein
MLLNNPAKIEKKNMKGKAYVVILTPKSINIEVINNSV